MLDFLGGLIGGALSFIGQDQANDANVQMATGTNAFNREEAAINRTFSAEQAARAMSFTDAQAARAMQFSGDQAAIQRDFQAKQVNQQMSFQERMANTSWQRAVGDMKAAGLNPMLAYSQGGASVPSGASASGAAGQAAQGSGFQGSGTAARGIAARIENAIAPAINSANMTARVKNEIDNMKATNENLRKQGDYIEAQTELARAQVPYTQQATLTSQSSSNLMHNQMAKVNVEVRKAWEEIDNLIEQRRKIKSEAELREFDANKMRPAELQLIQAETKLRELEIPRAANVSSAQGSWWMQNMSPYVQDFLGVGRGMGGMGLRMRR